MFTIIYNDTSADVGERVSFPFLEIPLDRDMAFKCHKASQIKPEIPFAVKSFAFLTLPEYAYLDEYVQPIPSFSIAKWRRLAFLLMTANRSIIL
jgi:hypothetical protein